MTSPLTLIAVTDFGLEAVARRELAELGYEGRVVSPGRIEFSGDLSALCRANLWLRTADRVLLQLASFAAEDFDTLFETAQRLEWHTWIGVDAAFPVIGRCYQSQLSSLPACQRTVKKAVVESLRAAYQVETLPETGPEYKIEVAILKNQATLSIDTTGPGLHKRGYRQQSTSAPLKESMAAALVLLSFWRDGRPLIDPFCGSGTIPIEAALIGRNRAPGLLRTFAAEQWPEIAENYWAEARTEAEDLGRPGLQENLIGSDIDPRAIRSARHNAEIAGVSDQIHFQQKPFAELSSQRKYGCVVANPPYGERLGDHQDWTSLYESIPVVLRRLATWSHFILTSYPRFETLIQRPADRRRKLYNGRIECTYYQFHGPRPKAVEGRPATVKSTPEGSDTAVAPASKAGPNAAPHPVASNLPMSDERDFRESAPVALNPDTLNPDALNPDALNPDALNAPVSPESTSATPDNSAVTSDSKATLRKTPVVDAPVFGGLSDKSHEQATLFQSRLQKTVRHLRRWPTKRGIRCFRLYDRDIPEIPLSVDRYDTHLRIVEHERPHDRDLAHHADWLDLMAGTAADVTGIARHQVHMIRYDRQRLADGRSRRLPAGNAGGTGQQQAATVVEGGLQFEVSLTNPAQTGLPLDYRTLRSMVRKQAEGRDVLILFGEGAMAACAAAGNGRSVTMVDSSQFNLQRAERNLAANSVSQVQHALMYDAPWRFLKHALLAQQYDLAVVTAPTKAGSASNTREQDSWEIQPDHVQLLNNLLAHMRPTGVVFFLARHRRFKLDAGSLEAGDVREISRQTVPEDFRNRRIHRCWRITK